MGDATAWPALVAASDALVPRWYDVAEAAQEYAKRHNPFWTAHPAPDFFWRHRTAIPIADRFDPIRSTTPVRETQDPAGVPPSPKGEGMHSPRRAL